MPGDVLVPVLLNIKTVGHVKKRNGVKGDNILEMVRILRLVINHAEQTRSCEAVRKDCISQGKHMNVETTEARICQLDVEILICMTSDSK
jgi:hypothetical protein